MMTSEEDLQDAAMFAAEWDTNDSGRRIVESLIADSRALRKLTAQNAKLIEALGPFNRCIVTGNPCGTDTWRIGDPCSCRCCVASGVLKEIEDG